jgi:hypothetical protein
MKLRNTPLFFALIVAVFSTSVAAQRTTAPSPVARSPEVVLKEFYKWYIYSINHYGKAPDPYKEGKTTLKKYVTLRFIREIERNEKLPVEDAFDGDYFLQMQDTSGITGKNISVSKVAIKGATATAIVTLDHGRGMVKVSLRQEGGVWKIDNVK